MRTSIHVLKQVIPPFLKRFSSTTPHFNLNAFNSSSWRLTNNHHQRNKVVFIMGAIGTGKTRLSINLATSFKGEIINSDKIQVYKGLDILTNKATKQEQCGFPHHLLSIIANPNLDFTTKDFCIKATQSVESILQKGKLPIIVGGSNSYIESLVSNPKYGFKSKYDCCFLWVDVSLPELHTFVSHRVDKMVEAGLIQEVRSIFDPTITDFSQGIRRAIGVPELDSYFRAERVLGKAEQAQELERCINKIKEKTCELSRKQVDKIYRLKGLKGWDLHRVDATEVFRNMANNRADEAWDKHVAKPSKKIVGRFLNPGFGPSEEVVKRNWSNIIQSFNKQAAQSA